MSVAAILSRSVVVSIRVGSVVLGAKFMAEEFEQGSKDRDTGQNNLLV